MSSLRNKKKIEVTAITHERKVYRNDDHSAIEVHLTDDHSIMKVYLSDCHHSKLKVHRSDDHSGKKSIEAMITME